MIEPHVYIAYAPRGPGVMSAVFYVEVSPNIYGWCVGALGYEYPARFFVLEDYYVDGKTRLYLSVEDDVHGPWIQREVAVDVEIGAAVPMPEAIKHELERAQDAFIHEWLFYADDPHSAQQASAYVAHDLAVQPVNIRADRLNKLSTDAVVWTYASPGCDLNVIRMLSRRWPLDYVLD